MSRNRHGSIQQSNRLIFATMSVFSMILLCSFIYGLNSYNKSMRYYTEHYYVLAEFSSSMKTFEEGLVSYGKNKDKSALSELMAEYDAASDIFDKISSKRSSYGDTVKEQIDGVKEALSDLKAQLKRQEANGYNGPGVTNLGQTTEHLEADLFTLLTTFVEGGNHNYDAEKGVLIILEIIMLLSLLGFIAFAIYFVYFTRRRIISPIKEISEWSTLFKEGYDEMEDLKHDNEDEIKQLVDAFNIVKERLKTANMLKNEYEALARKLQYEEEHKKKFVQQLYDEKREKEHISIEAKRDSLTGLLNRRSFDALVDGFLHDKDGHVKGALFIVDMDNFKHVNDTLGHPVGDEALKILAGTMSAVFPPGNCLGRYGGDEFIAFIKGDYSLEQFLVLGSELCSKMDRDISGESDKAHLSVSVGVAVTAGVQDYSELYMNADKALYQAKSFGRNRCILFSENKCR